MTFRTPAVDKDLQHETCAIFNSHGTAANALMCDGSVRTLSKDSLQPKELKALITIDRSDAAPPQSPPEGNKPARQ
jgi:prepilin-type processing-associated H-X9-DG protein